MHLTGEGRVLNGKWSPVLTGKTEWFKLYEENSSKDWAELIIKDVHDEKAG